MNAAETMACRNLIASARTRARQVREHVEKHLAERRAFGLEPAESHLARLNLETAVGLDELAAAVEQVLAAFNKTPPRLKARRP